MGIILIFKQNMFLLHIALYLQVGYSIVTFQAVSAERWRLAVYKIDQRIPCRLNYDAICHHISYAAVLATWTPVPHIHIVNVYMCSLCMCVYILWYRAGATLHSAMHISRFV